MPWKCDTKWEISIVKSFTQHKLRFSAYECDGGKIISNNHGICIVGFRIYLYTIDTPDEHSTVEITLEQRHIRVVIFLLRTFVHFFFLLLPSPLAPPFECSAWKPIPHIQFFVVSLALCSLCHIFFFAVPSSTHTHAHTHTNNHL